jgi:Ino eighty subunit 1
VAHDHFGRLEIDLLDLFLPIKISSLSRARAFLWLAFHYHEAPSVNPFDDDHARQNVGRIPELVILSEKEFEQENVDPEDERDYATKMTKLRMEFLAKNAQATESNNPKDRKGIAKSKAKASPPGRSIPTKRERSDPDSSVEEGNAEEIDQLSIALHVVSPLALLMSRSRPTPAETTTERSNAARNLSCAFRILNATRVYSTF